jgi:hypothetical protein
MSRKRGRAIEEKEGEETESKIKLPRLGVLKTKSKSKSIEDDSKITDDAYRMSGSSSMKNNYEYYRGRITEKLSEFPLFSENSRINSLYGIYRVLGYTVESKKILLCADIHEYAKCTDKRGITPTYLLDWIRAMCVDSPETNLTLLIEHPPAKKMFRRYNPITFIEPISMRQGHMFGITWKLRNKLVLPNFMMRGVDARSYESGGTFLSGYSIIPEELRGAEQNKLIDYIITLIRTGPVKKKRVDDGNPVYRLISYFRGDRKIDERTYYLQKISNLISNALDESIFNDNRTRFFDTLSHVSKLHAAYDLERGQKINNAESVIMDAYCLATLFKRSASNTIVNAGWYHIDTYEMFLDRFFDTSPVFKIGPPTFEHAKKQDCIIFNKPYDFLKDNMI